MKSKQVVPPWFIRVWIQTHVDNMWFNGIKLNLNFMFKTICAIGPLSCRIMAVVWLKGPPWFKGRIPWPPVPVPCWQVVCAWSSGGACVMYCCHTVHPSLPTAGCCLLPLLVCCYGVLPCGALQTQTPPVPERRKPGRKPKIDPRTLYGQKLTGEENVSVIERGTGRKVR
jgi:hypothetical protein